MTDHPTTPSPAPDQCPACGGPVTIHSADEGTGSYEPAEPVSPDNPWGCRVCGGLDREAFIRSQVRSPGTAFTTAAPSWPAKDGPLAFLLRRLDETREALSAERAARQRAEAERDQLREGIVVLGFDPAEVLENLFGEKGDSDA